MDLEMNASAWFVFSPLLVQSYSIDTRQTNCSPLKRSISKGKNTFKKYIAFWFRLCTKKYNYNDKLISTSLPNFAFLAQGSGTEKKPTKSLHPDYSKVFLRPSILHSCRHCEPSLDTPRKINMEPENTPLEKENHLPNHHFQVQAVNLPGCISFCG